MKDLDDMINERVRQLNKDVEDSMLEQLGDIVKKGLLVWEQSGQRIYNDHGPKGEPVFRIGCHGKLVLKDKEYIEKLELENARLAAAAKEVISMIQSLIYFLSGPYCSPHETVETLKQLVSALERL